VKKENNDIVLLFAIVFLLESNYETNFWQWIPWSILWKCNSKI
jgi:hypothetical protein